MKPFRIEIAQQELDDLHQRLAITRWPDAGPEAGWARGIPRKYLEDLVQYWQHSYDWRAAEAQLNEFDQFSTEIDGANVHFLHVRSPELDAVPLLLTHSWPGSFVEFLDLIGPLSDPRSHGADPSRALHLVIPTIPGFGFSGPTTDKGWGVQRVARAWASLMSELGYHRYIAQGADWGMPISLRLGQIDAEHVAGVHVGMLVTFPPSPEAISDLTPAEQASLGRALEFSEDGFGYQKLLATRPQTVSYALTDSPVGQLAWIIEKFQEWSGAVEVPEEVFDRDRLLTNVMIYWLTATAGSSAQIYYEDSHLTADFIRTWGGPWPLTVPVGVANFQQDPAQPIRRWAEQLVPSLSHWTDFPQGGHFGAMERPADLVDDLRAFVFDTVRPNS
ncbi:MAG TPA: epoxide hydrolase [Jatrophihabitans sp.]|nr:epoxide hydrolase [Jatrophihabitans sp.]